MNRVPVREDVFDMIEDHYKRAELILKYQGAWVRLLFLFSRQRNNRRLHLGRRLIASELKLTDRQWARFCKILEGWDLLVVKVGSGRGPTSRSLITLQSRAVAPHELGTEDQLRTNSGPTEDHVSNDTHSRKIPLESSSSPSEKKNPPLHPSSVTVGSKTGLAQGSGTVVRAANSSGRGVGKGFDPRLEREVQMVYYRHCMSLSRWRTGDEYHEVLPQVAFPPLTRQVASRIWQSIREYGLDHAGAAGVGIFCCEWSKENKAFQTSRIWGGRKKEDNVEKFASEYVNGREGTAADLWLPVAPRSLEWWACLGISYPGWQEGVGVPLSLPTGPQRIEPSTELDRLPLSRVRARNEWIRKSTGVRPVALIEDRESFQERDIDPDTLKELRRVRKEVARASRMTRSGQKNRLTSNQPD